VPPTDRFLGLVGLLAASMIRSVAFAEEAADANTPARPEISFYRWQENWSALADPKLRTQPLDCLKYIPLSSTDPESYLSLGLTVRERFESNDAPLFGVGKIEGDSYLLDRAQIHADFRPDSHWQAFVQLEDVRAPWKDVITPVDENPLDLRLAFVAYTNALFGGVLKVRAGRQEMAFDLQRFVSVRDGPNVRQAYDAVWLDWEKDSWRFITFWSHPVQYRHVHPFDDFSSRDFQYGGLRAEWKVGPGKLSTYYSRFIQDGAEYLAASGTERRNILDVHYGGRLNDFDWDFEAMGQTGGVGAKNVRAWALGSLNGYTFSDFVWSPRIGLQIDAASGNRNPTGGTLETFNPLFPNGYYFTLSGYTGYVNLIHLKPSLTVRPTPKLMLLAAIGLEWRETISDAVYVQPTTPVPGTAGRPGRWTGFYGELRAEWAITANLAADLEATHFQVADVIRNAGGHNSDYLEIELRFGW
jgi:hypothetical protein